MTLVAEGGAFIARGSGRTLFYLEPCGSARLNAGLNDPAISVWEELRTLNDIEEVALAYELVEVSHRVATEFLIVEV